MDTSSGKESDEKGGTNNLRETFDSFLRFGDRESDGETITLKNIDKWMKQAGILDGKKITNADTAITFSKIAKTKKRLNMEEFQAFMQQLAEDKKTEFTNFIDRLLECKEPGLSSITKPVATGAVGANLRRMTDTRLYTGSHKERFDEDGQGRGLEGREDVVDDAGYVQGYKEKDTYDEKTKEA